MNEELDRLTKWGGFAFTTQLRSDVEYRLVCIISLSHALTNTDILQASDPVCTRNNDFQIFETLSFHLRLALSPLDRHALWTTSLPWLWNPCGRRREASGEGQSQCNEFDGTSH